MALFKILKGDSSRIDTSITSFHDGYAYFTPDDGGFYIDSEDNGVQNRIRINRPTVIVPATVDATKWVDNKQTISVTGLSASSNGIISVAQNITDEQMESAKSAELHAVEQGDGYLVVEANGVVPSIDIPVSVAIFY